MKISWETKSSKLYDVLLAKDRSNVFMRGGNLYEYEVYRALSKKYSLYPNKSKVKTPGQNIIQYLVYNFLYANNNFDLFISDPYSFTFNVSPNYKRQIVIMHHLNYILMQRSYFYRLFGTILLNRLKKAYKIVTVSNYWRDFLIQKGIPEEKIVVIYNSFDVSKYKVDNNQKEDFMSKYQFNNDQPIIYLGVADPIKGVYEAYDKLKNDGYQLVMTGSENKTQDIDAIFLDLPDYEFRILLNLCDVVVSMSKLTEGWNRVAHESLLVGTPVVGSGVCGMEELLKESKQLICSDIDDLSEMVKNAIKNKITLSKLGYSYVSRFSIDYLTREWVKIIDSNNVYK